MNKNSTFIPLLIVKSCIFAFCFLCISYAKRILRVRVVVQTPYLFEKYKTK